MENYKMQVINKQLNSKILDQEDGLIQLDVKNKIINDIKFIGVKENVAYILIENTYTSLLVKNQYYHLVEKILSEILESNFTLKIVDQADEVSFEHEEEKQAAPQNNYSEIQNDIDTSYLLSNFIVNNTNSLAHSYATSVIKSPGENWNPLFINGNSGYGKTHLICGIGNEIINASNGRKYVKYIDATRLKTELLRAFRDSPKAAEDLKEKLYKYDVLIIDDIQFISGAASIEGVFFEIFNRFIQARKQIIITSDVTPGEMEEQRMFHKRILTRFQQGGIAKIDKPNDELKTQIVNHFIKSQIQGGNMYFSSSALKLLTSTFDDIRSIRGAINNIQMYLITHGITSDEITEEIVRAALSHHISRVSKSKQKPSISYLAKIISKEWGVDVKGIQGKARTKNIKNARNCLCYIARNSLDLTFKEIGAYINKEHSTVMNGIKSFEKALASDESIDLIIKNTRKKLGV